MMVVIASGLLIGLDNLQVASGLGLLGLTRRQRIQLAVMFGLFEGLMPLVGLLLGAALVPGEAAALIGPGLLLAAGLVVIIGALRGTDPARGRPWMLLVLPAALSLDNLLAGAGLGAMGYPVLATAAVIGLLSATMAGLGLLVGGMLRGWLSGRADLISGLAMIALALVLAA